jgi:tetratricopeptide (TPR) repeat protein
VIRIAVFLALIALAALGAAWFADRPGEIVLTWQGWRISTSLMVAAVALLAAMAIAIFFWFAIGYVLRSPRRVADYLEERKQLRGWRSLSRGLIAVGTGNVALAKRSAGEAQKLLAAEPLTLLLSAQAAQLSGDVDGAESNFRHMLEHADTKLLGLHGLFVEAQRRGDPVAALAFAEEAAHLDPALYWAGEAVLEFRCRAGDWTGALEALQRQIDAKAISKPAGKRRRAVLLTAQAHALEEIEPARARELAVEAAKLAPASRAGAGGCRAHGSAGGQSAPGVAHDRKGFRQGITSGIGGRLWGYPSGGQCARAARSHEDAGAQGARPSGIAHGGRARRNRRKRLRTRARYARTAARGAHAARVSPDGGDRSGRARRSRQGAGMDRARGAGAARSGLGRRRLCVGALAADFAALGQARRLRLGRAAGSAWRAGARTGGAAGACRSFRRGGTGCRRRRRQAIIEMPAPRKRTASRPETGRPARRKAAEPVIAEPPLPDDPGPEPGGGFGAARVSSSFSGLPRLRGFGP